MQSCSVVSLRILKKINLQFSIGTLKFIVVEVRQCLGSALNKAIIQGYAQRWVHPVLKCLLVLF